MTLQQFLQLNINEQEQAVKHGLKLAERDQPDFKYELYQLDDFYVELKIQQSEENCVVGFQTFETLNELEPYLELMKIKT